MYFDDFAEIGRTKFVIMDWEIVHLSLKTLYPSIDKCKLGTNWVQKE